VQSACLRRSRRTFSSRRRSTRQLSTGELSSPPPDQQRGQKRKRQRRRARQPFSWSYPLFHSLSLPGLRRVGCDQNHGMLVSDFRPFAAEEDRPQTAPPQPRSRCSASGGWLSSKPSVFRERPIEPDFDNFWFGGGGHLSCELPKIFSATAAIVSEADYLSAVVPSSSVCDVLALFSLEFNQMVEGSVCIGLRASCRVCARPAKWRA
jgi:hypothetical protein